MRLAFVFLLICHFAFSQTEKTFPNHKHLSVTVLPFHGLYGTGRIDINHVIGSKYGGVLSLDFKTRNTQEKGNIVETHSFGFGLGARRFFSENENTRPYIAVQGGVVRSNFDYQIKGPGWITFEEDGLIYYMPGQVITTGRQVIHNPNTALTIGLERHPNKGVLAFEIFFGIGYQWSFINTEKNIQEFTPTGSTTPYFKGVRSIFGIKLGVFIY